MSDLHPVLADGFERWRQHCHEQIDWEVAKGFCRETDVAIRRDWINHLGDKVRPHLPLLLANHRDKTPGELRDLAAKLSPGGTHTGGWLIESIDPFLVDELLRVAIIYYNWTGGKAGFQFLPDPADVDLSEYEDEANRLLEELAWPLADNPLRVLVDDDAAFYRSLPASFTVYRGCSGITEDHARRGVCWTTRRDIAEWFARRFARADRAPIVLTAKIRKEHVILALANEHEVVCQPWRSRAIACRPKPRVARRPGDFTWRPTA